MTAPRLIMFTRFPEPGRAKTRLIPALGAEGAATMHRRLTERTLAVLRAAGLTLEVWVTGATPDAFRSWLGDDLVLRPQGDGDLGARMRRALDDTPAILVGSDLPGLATRHIAAAATFLAHGETVLGPAEDGGYYLIGLPERAPFLFDAMAWSTDGVLAETCRRLDRHGRRYARLETLADLDRPQDLPRFAALLG